MSLNQSTPPSRLGDELAKGSAIAFCIALGLTLLSKTPGPMGALFGKALEENQAPVWSLLSLIVCGILLTCSWAWRIFFAPTAQFLTVVKQSALVLLGTSHVLCGVQLAVCLGTWSIRPWGSAILAASLIFNYTIAVESVLSPVPIKRGISLLRMLYHSLMLVSLVLIAQRVSAEGWESLLKGSPWAST